MEDGVWDLRLPPGPLMRGGMPGYGGKEHCPRFARVNLPATPAEPLDGPIYVTVGLQPQPRGFTWRIWSGGTSFYLKSKAPGLENIKVSFHGDDPRPH